MSIVAAAILLAAAAAPQLSPAPSATRQPLSDAWWTGPTLAASAATLPQGHVLIEPYVYNTVTAHANGWGSLSYLLYGLTDRLTVGAMPTVGYNAASNAVSSSGVAFGDTTLIAQYGLTKFRLGSAMPSTAVAVQQSFPTGRYDNLGNRPSDGIGSGAFTTTLALYTQTYFWLGNGRILRARLDLSQAFSSSAGVDGVSVYGTSSNFSGTAQPGSSFFTDAAGEYSISRNWVLALDLTYRLSGGTYVGGNTLQTSSGASVAYGFAPAVEYNMSAALGVLLGTRIIPKGRNTAPSITPAIAVNFVR
jgi:hypothetical protein